MGAIKPIGVTDFSRTFKIQPGSHVHLSRIKPEYTAGYEDRNGIPNTVYELNKMEIARYQRILYAEEEKALLIVLQGMDASGKDGTIRHVLGEIDPFGCEITPFKAPTDEELSHDFLWRIHKHVPPKGFIGVFNRSHYEDVLVPKVKGIVPKEKINERYEQINDFEKMLTDNDVKILKFFLYISEQEQKDRFEKRIEDPTKSWKLNLQDLEERKLWPKYKKAYEELLRRCSTEWAPWFIIPSNHKWFRNFVISQIILDTLKEMDLEYPEPKFDPQTIEIE